MEVPLHELQPKAGPAKAMLDVHCSLVALVKDAKGEVVQKLSRDRGFQVTPDQLKMGNFLDKMTVTLPAGKYSLESAVMDRESGKIGTQRSEFTVPAKAAGVAISSLTPMRSYTPNAKGLDPNDPFQFQGGSVTPTMDLTVKKGPNAVLRLFFTVYQDASISAAPAVEIEFLQGGQGPDESADATARRRRAGQNSVPDDDPGGVHSVRQLRGPRHCQTGRDRRQLQHDDSDRVAVAGSNLRLFNSVNAIPSANLLTLAVKR